MVTAKNYAAQAERGLKEFFDIAEAVPHSDIDRTLVEVNMLDHIKKAIHFAIPDGGVIIDDDWKGMRDVPFRLPYPEITIEYYVPYTVDTVNDPLRGGYSPKRLVVAIECSLEQFEKQITIMNVKNPGADHKADFMQGMPQGTTHFVMVTYAMTAPWVRKDLWVPGFVGVIIPSLWDSGTHADTPRTLGCTPFTLCPAFAECETSGLEKDAAKERYESFLKDVSQEVGAVFELLEALTCRNVSTITREKISPKINARRARAGKVPLYETKVLVIDREGEAPVSPRHHGDRHGPRQHLRRGHIRRLPSGNIWVNSCLVGAGNQGYIDKSYAVN